MNTNTTIQTKIELWEQIKRLYKFFLESPEENNKAQIRKWIYQINMKIVAQKAIMSNNQDTVCRR